MIRFYKSFLIRMGLYIEIVQPVFKLIVKSLPLILLTISMVIINMSNMFFLTRYQNNALIGGYGLGFTFWICSVYAPI